MLRNDFAAIGWVFPWLTGSKRFGIVCHERCTFIQPCDTCLISFVEWVVWKLDRSRIQGYIDGGISSLFSFRFLRSCYVPPPTKDVYFFQCLRCCFWRELPLLPSLGKKERRQPSAMQVQRNEKRLQRGLQRRSWDRVFPIGSYGHICIYGISVWHLPTIYDDASEGSFK